MSDILTRALWLCNQVPRLHELSYDMGLRKAAPASLLQMQIIMEAADKLQVDLSIAIGTRHASE